MKIFLFTVILQDGDHEHLNYALIRATDMDSAWKIGNQELHDIGETANGKHWSYGDGETATRAVEMQEIKSQEAKILRKLGVVHYLND
jgi:hypothetical protein